MNQELKSRLNEGQYEAVTTLDGPVLVIAGAGSGKTRVIEYRARHLVEKGINPGSILLLTFTRRSAREMISRAARHDPRCRSIEGGTFHSFANRILRKYSRFFDLPADFTIYDESDAEEAVHRCAVKLGFYGREKRRPRKDMLRKILSMAVNKEMPIEGILMRHYSPFIRFAPEIAALREKYSEYKIASQCLDYDDLLLYLRLLLEDEAMRTRIAETYKYIMVDEFQDTNTLQADITWHLSRNHGNVLVVGDDAQSIYSFRGSSHENIMKFPERFPGCKVITLEKNYRSTQAILDAGNAVLDNMRHRYRKCLRAATKEYGEKPRLIQFRDSYDEATWVAEQVKDLYDRGVELSHQCILFRSAYITIPLQAELSRRNIPFTVYGGLKFYETAHVKDVVAHLKLFINPKDELAWSRVLLLIEGIGIRTAEKLLDEIRSGTDEASIRRVLARHGSGRPYSRGIGRLSGLIAGPQDESTPSRLCEAVVAYYEPILREKFDLDWNLRKNDLEALVQLAGRYDALRDFLVDLALEPPERGVKDFHDTVWERPLILSTIHSAKGLEWRYVYLIGAIDGVLPSSYATHDESGLEEEQRLLYVAITRARERLSILLHHEGVNNGIRTFNRLSRFVDAPNVRACLNEKLDFSCPHPEEVAFSPATGYDQASLLRKLRSISK